MSVRQKVPEDLTARKALALEVIDRLKKEYPDAGCTLDYDDAWKLLVSVRLAAQCTDARVNVVVEKLYEKFPNAKCEEFYSDSLSDTPLAELADKAMIIRGNELIEWNEYKPSKLKMFLSREFLSFLIVGGINTVSNVIFSTIYSLFIPNTTLAFFPGYITSNVVSYLLNSKLTFKERLGFVKFIKFFISYIPNFIIQTIIVWLFDNFIHGPSVIAYAIAAIIGVPVTFVFMKIFTFKKND